MRRYKFGEEYFLLNSYNKVRVILAMHILSQTMIRMIIVIQREKMLKIGRLLLKSLIKLKHRLMDICSARYDRGVDCLN